MRRDQARETLGSPFDGIDKDTELLTVIDLRDGGDVAGRAGSSLLMTEYKLIINLFDNIQSCEGIHSDYLYRNARDLEQN
jgi:hypothetical protein